MKKIHDFIYSLQKSHAKAKARRIKESNALYKMAYGHEKPKWTTNKIIVTFLMINFVIVELFAMIATLIIRDMSALVIICGACISEVILYLIYALKSIKENTEGGIVYESAIREWDKDAKG